MKKKSLFFKEKVKQGIEEKGLKGREVLLVCKDEEMEEKYKFYHRRGRIKRKEEEMEENNRFLSHRGEGWEVERRGNEREFKKNNVMRKRLHGERKTLLEVRTKRGGLRDERRKRRGG